MPRESQLKKSEKRPRESADTDGLSTQTTPIMSADDASLWSSDIINNLSSIAKGVERLQAASPSAERLERLVATSSKTKEYLVKLAAVQKRLCELMAEPVFEEVVTANRAASLLSKWPGNAPRAFWEAMKEGDSTEVAMAIVMDCGLEQRADDMDDTSSNGLTLLGLAARAWRTDVVSALLVAGADPNAQNSSALYQVCMVGDLESFKALIAAGATITKYMMCGAAFGGNVDIIKLLAAKGLSAATGLRYPNVHASPLHIAAKEGRTSAVGAILDLGVDVDGLTSQENRDSGDQSALTLAAARGHIKTVKLLVARGADVNKCVRTRERALDVAVKRDNVAMVKTLLGLGADPKDYEVDRIDFHVSQYGRPVYSCCNVLSVEVAKSLVSYGATVEANRLSKKLPKPVLEYYFQQILLNKHR